MTMKYLQAVIQRCIAVAVLLSGCATPVDEGDTRYSELESVWQYLKVYCIYQWDDSTRVPDDPFVFSSPSKLMDAIADILHGVNYTQYNVAGSTSGSARIQSSLTKSTTVFLDTLTDSTVRIRITEFASDVTLSEFTTILPYAKSFPNIIVDLCKNPGGDINAATAIAGAFLPAGAEYIKARERDYNDETRTAQTLEHSWSTPTSPVKTRDELAGKNVTVLMNRGSASSSEILIVALKNGINATLVGDTTYGKGIGQILIERKERPAIKITYLQLGQKKISDYHLKGIPPDIIADTDDEAAALLTAVKVHEPKRTAIKGFHKRAFSLSPIGGYKVVYE
jgi:hypothetical protein